MAEQLDLLDLQGNIVKAYARFGYYFARYVFLRINNGEKARAFLQQLLPHITTAANWAATPDLIPQPNATANVAFTYDGLKAIGLPRVSLMGFSPEFAMGMKKRKDILGDDGPSSPENWDPIWHNESVHMMVSLNGLSPDYLESRYQWLLGLVTESDGGVEILKGHRGENGVEDLAYQSANVVFENGRPTSKEHFGYTDGIGDPIFAGLPDAALRVNGRGKQMESGWAPLATGEFILGHVDEAKEYPPAPRPFLLSRNGTYMVYRKLHENVGSFNELLDRESKTYPGGKELLAAKFIGRWRDNGAPLMAAPDAASKNAWDQRFAQATPEQQDRMLSDFTYDDDPHGTKCPFSAHLRRINPRASLELTKGAFETPGALANRRRIIRRGLPYGEVKDQYSDEGNHGIIIMMINADIGRQFEFVQQQWINYGNDFRAGNDKEIILGNHDAITPSKAVIPVNPDSDQAPYFVRNIPRLVVMRGGDYFFIPSMTALRMIALGTVDPT